MRRRELAFIRSSLLHLKNGSKGPILDAFDDDDDDDDDDDGDDDDDDDDDDIHNDFT